MTKEKIKNTIKHISKIYQAVKDKKDKVDIYVGKRLKPMFIDKEILTMLEIINEIIDNEEDCWVKGVLLNIIKGFSDINIIVFSPIERTKYYEIKREFENKIYQCCIFKQLVKYDDILKTRLG